MEYIDHPYKPKKAGVIIGKVYRRFGAWKQRNKNAYALSISIIEILERKGVDTVQVQAVIDGKLTLLETSLRNFGLYGELEKYEDEQLFLEERHWRVF